MSAKTLCALTAVLALGLAGCGDDDEETATTTTGAATQEQPSPPEEPPSETVRITETEFAIAPADVNVPKAGVVEFKVENAGGVPHALEVESDELEEETDEIAPGERATLTIDLPTGTYELYCPIGDHEDRGMVATLTVGPPDEPRSGGGGSGGADAPEGGDDSGGAEAPESGDDSGGAEAPPPSSY